MNNKKFLIILIVILISLVTFLGGYLVAQKNNSLQANISNLHRFSSSVANYGHLKQENKNLPQLIRLSTVKAADPAISEDGKKILYFERDSGKILSADFSGQNSSLVMGKILSGLTEAKWAPNGSKVIVNQKGGKKSYLELETEEAVALSTGISDLAWDKNSLKIAYLFYDSKTGDGQISIANPDGSVFKNIIPTRANRLKIDWVNNDKISFYSPTEEDHSLFSLDIESKQLEKVLDSLLGLKIIWSPDGSKLLYSHQPPFVEASGDRKQVELALLDLESKAIFAVDLQTEADRCVWSLNSLYIYCGASSTRTADNPQLNSSEQFSDSLYQLDIARKEFGLIFKPSLADEIKIKKPLLSPAENFLFFINDLDQYLYRINLEN